MASGNDFNGKRKMCSIACGATEKYKAAAVVEFHCILLCSSYYCLYLCACGGKDLFMNVKQRTNLFITSALAREIIEILHKTKRQQIARGHRQQIKIVLHTFERRVKYVCLKTLLHTCELTEYLFICMYNCIFDFSQSNLKILKN